MKQVLLAALIVLAPGAVVAQTITATATSNNGDRDPATPGLQVHEGDTISLIWIATPTIGSHQSIFVGTASQSADISGEKLAAGQCYPIPDPLGAIVFTIRDDTDPEGDETIGTSVDILYDNTAPNCGGNEFHNMPVNIVEATITILANDGGSQANIGGADATAYEGRSVNIPIILTGATRTAASTVTFSITGTAGAADYMVDASGSAITFNAASATGAIVIDHTAAGGSIPIAIAADTDDDGGETIIVTLTGHTGGGSGVTGFFSAAARTITTEAPQTFSFSAPPQSVAEGTTATYTVSRTGPDLATTLTVVWTFSAGDTEAADFRGGAYPTTGTLAFHGTDASREFVIPVADDTLNEGDESFSVRLGTAGDVSAEGIVLPSAPVATTLTDDDAIAAGLVVGSNIPPAAINEGETLDMRVGLFDVGGALAESEGDITVSYTVAAGAGTGPAPEFVDPAGGSITIAAGATSGVIRVVVRSSEAEPPDTGNLTVTLTGVRRGDSRAGTIALDNRAPTRTQAVVQVNYLQNPVDTTPPALTGLSWLAGQQSVWLTTEEDEPFLVLPHPGGAMTASGVSSLTTLPAGDFSVIENCCGATSATVVVLSVRVISSSRALELNLERGISAEASSVWVEYVHGGGNAIYDLAVERGRAGAIGRNRIVSQGPFMLPATGDADDDGIPDAVEISAGENPLAAIAASSIPSFTMSRDNNAVNPIAYSGIREHGLMRHLGVSGRATTASPTASTRLTAYYRSGDFGYDGGNYPCGSGAFPATYALPLSQGGCAPVDWGNIRPGVEYTIMWLAQSAEGLWSVDARTASNLPQQRIERIPEVNMTLRRVFTTATGVVLRASADDGRAAPNVTLTMLQTTATAPARRVSVAGSDSSGVFAVTDRSGVSGTWEITDLTRSGASVLWRPSTDSAAASYPDSTDYSVGLSRQTEVVYTEVAVPPVFGRATLARAEGPVSVLQEGVNDYTLTVPVANFAAVEIVAGLAVDRNAVLNDLTGSVAPDANGMTYTIRFNVNANARTVTETAVLDFGARTVGSAPTTASYRYPIVAAGSAFGRGRADTDADGIPNVADEYDGSAHLPVTVEDESRAGAQTWHHIRPVLRGHALSPGDATRERLAASVMVGAENAYDTYAASALNVASANGALAVVYDFEVSGVENGAVMESGVSGGRAGVIIPLPRSLYSAVASLVKYNAATGGHEPFVSVAGENEYGSAPLQNGVCPDDTMDENSPYYDGARLSHTKRAGDACVVVYIVDGSVAGGVAYDEDREVNGLIRDPLGVRAGVGGVTGGAGARSHGGGAFGLAGLAALALLLLFSARRRRAL